LRKGRREGENLKVFFPLRSAVRVVGKTKSNGFPGSWGKLHLQQNGIVVTQK
jgi:hypothetical protein